MGDFLAPYFFQLHTVGKQFLCTALLCSLLFLHAGSVCAQNSKGNAASNPSFKTHKVAPKENWYSIGRLYNLGPRDIAAYNELTIDIGLHIGQVIKIPINPAIPVSKQEPTKPTQVTPPPVQPSASAPAAVKSTAPNTSSNADNSNTVGIRGTREVTSGGKDFFTPIFEEQSKGSSPQRLENPVYGVFKSTSGWQDRKYYVLMNNAVPGTIARLKVVKTGMVICAKVLGSVPVGKESEGVDLRLSNAAAAALGIAETGIGAFEVLWYN